MAQRFRDRTIFSLTPGELATAKTRRTPELQLGLALHIGFLRMSGRVLNSTDAIARRILGYLGTQLEIRPPRVTSLRALYPRKQTLHEHQHMAVAQLRFGPFIERAERHLVAYLRQIRGAATRPDELLDSGRQWVHEHRYLMPSTRQLLDCARAVLADEEAQLARALRPPAARHGRTNLRRHIRPSVASVDWIGSSSRPAPGEDRDCRSHSSASIFCRSSGPTRSSCQRYPWPWSSPTPPGSHD